MEQLRAFIAVELAAGARATVEQALESLRSLALDGVRWVGPSGAHLTLKFLGNVPVDSVESICQAMARCAGGAVPFTLALGGLGAFPNLSGPRVIWLGVSGDLEPISALHRSLEGELTGLGMPKESRTFRAHLTLGRVGEGVGPAQRRHIGQAVSAVPVETTTRLEVRAMALIKSTLTPSGARYELLRSIPLGLGL